jgi:hypothetical protein
VEQQHERAAALLDDVDAHAIGVEDVMMGGAHGEEVCSMGETLAVAIYGVYNDGW